MNTLRKKGFFQRIFCEDDSGQAALMDSMFFTIIVASVCTALFYFVVNYGTGQEKMLTSFYSSDFAMDSLKVVNYINVLRDGTPVKLNSSGVQEYDYLLALIKEDYSQNKRFSLETKTAIANTVHSVLKPFESAADYAFFIMKEGASSSDSSFVALILSTHSPTPDREMIFYSCDPPPAAKNILEKKILQKVGKIDSATGRITLSDAPFVIGLKTWISKDIEAIMSIQQDTDFNCIVLEGIN
jgi:hypothetical protein